MIGGGGRHIKYYVAKYSEVIQLLTSLPETMQLHLSFAFTLGKVERRRGRL